MQKYYETRKKWIEKNRQKIRDYANSRYVKRARKVGKRSWKDPVQVKEYMREYHSRQYVAHPRILKSKEDKRLSRLNYLKKVRATNVEFRLLQNMRVRIRRSLKGTVKKSNSTTNLVGCSTEFLMEYLQNKFKVGMQWNNYGKGWHVDHIKPCASFNLLDPEEQKKCFHYTNLQPLWAFENVRKHAKII